MADYDESMQEAEEQRRQADGKQGKTKGRGAFTNLAEPNPAMEDRYGRARFSELDPRAGPGPTPSVEGWVVFATGVHEEAQEEDLHEAFSEYGEVKNIYMNLDRQTGFVKGYALIEYKSRKEAQAAIDALNGAEILGQKVSVDYAFKKGDVKKRAAQGRARR